MIEYLEWLGECQSRQLHGQGEVHKPTSEECNS